MKRYAEYKDSGIEWIGVIPSDWSCLQLRNVITQIKNGTTAPQIDEITNYCVSRIETISNGEINYEKVGYVNHFGQIEDYRLVSGDILFSNINSLAMIGNCAQYYGEKPLYNGMNVLRIAPQKAVDYKWLYYFISSYYFRNVVRSEAKPAINQASIPTTKIKSINICMPSLTKQREISIFLNTRTAAIDTLIADKQKLIDLLKEKRQAIISEAVTKGLDKNAKMKDSGIEWIGEMPEGWVIKPLFAVAYENKTKNAGNQCNNLLSLSYGKIINKDIETNFGLLPESFEAYQIVERGYTILRLTDLQNDKRSLRSGYVPENGIITSAYVGLIPTNQIDGLFLADLLHAYDLMKIFYGLGNGVRQSMNYNDLKRLPIIIPPKDEQMKISSYLFAETEKNDSLISDIQTQIEKLKEYRQGIISEAVTGKVAI